MIFCASPDNGAISRPAGWQELVSRMFPALAQAHLRSSVLRVLGQVSTCRLVGSSSILSIGELFRDGQKGVRFPKDLIKVLEQKLQDIAMGKDAAYVSPTFASVYPRVIPSLRPKILVPLTGNRHSTS